MMFFGPKRFPVNFRTERPFIIGFGITFGLITYLHHRLYKDRTFCFELVRLLECYI